MFCLGHEPDLSIEQVSWGGNFEGTIAEYKAMWAHYQNIFEEEGVTNVLWVMDFSTEIQYDSMHWVPKDLWPTESRVDWLFWNLYQQKPLTGNKAFDCPAMFNTIYTNFETWIADVPVWNDIPWGMAEWGSRQNEYGPAATEIPEADRANCLIGMKDLFESGDYPRFKASMNFNSLNCRIDEDMSAHMIPYYKELITSDAYYEPENAKWLILPVLTIILNFSLVAN